MNELARQQCLMHYSYTLEYVNCRDYDLVIVAIAEGMEAKKGVLQALDSIGKAGAIIDANTSLLSVTELASTTYRLESVIGMHFFNPVPAMKLVEIIRSQLTSDKAYEAVARLTEEMGKSPVAVREAPGFVVNRILIPMINEAVGILADGVASREERDTNMQMGLIILWDRWHWAA